MKTDADKRDKKKYCHFHCDHNHSTGDCFNLKEEIETLIHNGHLQKYVYMRREERSDKESNNKVIGEIHTIFSEPAGGDSNRARRAHARSISASKLLPPQTGCNQSYIHINASIVFEVSEIRYLLTTPLPVLKPVSDATIEIGIDNMSRAITESLGYS
ncbi:uncharacterized protein LOC131254945 [Magnolia sinica]|uniref:uncharacterized protein LOC131254945 n=1 Tax=Magnolia sinica TaxID=86752 RepID=UPI0026583FBA|nr:uncharacterized protein LOC131254945 [Magnolia sinica]